MGLFDFGVSGAIHGMSREIRGISHEIRRATTPVRAGFRVVRGPSVSSVFAERDDAFWVKVDVRCENLCTREVWVHSVTASVAGARVRAELPWQACALPLGRGLDQRLCFLIEGKMGREAILRATLHVLDADDVSVDIPLTRDVAS